MHFMHRAVIGSILLLATASTSLADPSDAPLAELAQLKEELDNLTSWRDDVRDTVNRLAMSALLHFGERDRLLAEGNALGLVEDFHGAAAKFAEAEIQDQYGWADRLLADEGRWDVIPTIEGWMEEVQEEIWELEKLLDDAGLL